MDIKNKLKEGLKPMELESKEIKYAMTPFGNADYNNALMKTGQDEKLPDGKIKCKICEKIYTAKNSGKHKRTQYHQLHVKMNNKLLSFINS